MGFLADIRKNYEIFETIRIRLYFLSGFVIITVYYLKQMEQGRVFMSQSEMGFRTAAFGFRREDVLEFIAQESDRRQQLETELENVRADAERFREEKEEADQAAKALLSEHDRILSEVKEKEAQIKALQASVRCTEEKIQTTEAALEKLRRENEALQKVLDDTQMENTDLSSKCTEYDEARDRLAEIELCAHERAEKIQHRAEQESCALIRQAQDVAERLLATIAQTKEIYWQALTSAERERERAHTNAVGALSQLDEIMNGLREQMTEPIESQKETEKIYTAHEEIHIGEQTAQRTETQTASCTGRERPSLAQVLGALRSGK